VAKPSGGPQAPAVGLAQKAEPFFRRLRESGIKLTPNRRRVLERFLEDEGPWTLGRLHRRLSDSGPSDISSVYRALEALRDAGLLEEFHLPGEKQTFFSLIRQGGGRTATSQTHHHHHIVCQDCGRVSHLDVCLPSGLLGRVEGASGFRVTEHHLEFRGICGDCGAGRG
jgi:Fe2+ or Zn2+ uptake regulation protein